MTPTESWIIRHAQVLADTTLSMRDLYIADGVFQDEPAAHARQIDGRGLLALPGIVDIHGDAFEKQIMPRPGVAFPIDMALIETDRQLVANGITTAYHALTWSWEPGLRGAEGARAMVDAVERLRPGLSADTRIHLRHETFNLDAEAEIIGWIGAGRIGCLAFNDHMEGTLKSRSRPEKVGKMIERTGLSRHAFLELVDEVYERREEVPGAIERLAAAARDAGLPMLSHDDTSPAQRAWFRDLGVSIAEFPINEETTAAAGAAGESIVFGAPNVIRNGSHTGCPSASDMVSRGLCTALASDYYYAALLAAPFRLAAAGVAAFSDAWALVSRGPANALGLHDRGSIRAGLRADMILVDPNAVGGDPDVAFTFVGGALRHARRSVSMI
ncbi:alpha-D-ribose 1-methylphosphonate 5-triphosphate diphosphatase [Prosthecodimorpha staleyi]|uniref:Alpha-D-ribose 1-methylphosphonate 5-triphosphate diphosphatase n=1 Tax=Prosthecodimorpha staleyi TaxID=2840188 RepID=A0A947D8N8_9HYPH|nr:alpha-D-ribose 1-methylphosphonate 5-triphosphate diphosphatase [Prosthecodimorpha staleyi]MBT9293173.1 alpha-D-ribose 1-methylphosphonate 5-triphosphate diphosphatase [Prosthecodimorpha staleyi]